MKHGQAGPANRVGRQLDTLICEQLQQHLDPVARPASAGSVDGLGFRPKSYRCPASPRPIDRMIRVERPSIKTDIGAETVSLDEPLRGVVAALAETLERTKPESVDVAVMRLDVIADFRRRDDTALQTKRAQRVFVQLVPPDSSPASRGVPFIPIRR